MRSTLRDTWGGFLAALLLFGSVAQAQVIEEMNYNHIDAEHALPAAKMTLHKNAKPLTQRFEGGTLGPTFGNGTGTSSGAQVFALALVLKEETCAFGGRIGIDPGAIKHSVKVTFTFFTRAGQVLGQQMRYPAGGTTRQAFAVRVPDQGFSAVRIASEGSPHLHLSDLRAEPCAIPLS